MKEQHQNAKRQVIEHRAYQPEYHHKPADEPYVQRWGLSTISGSTQSVAMVISGKSVIRFVSSICVAAAAGMAKTAMRPPC